VLVTGHLVNPSGQPIAGATVQVLQQDKLVGAALVPSGAVTTDATGAFTYTTTAVRSRTIRFAYRTHVEDATFASTTDIGLEVIAKIGLRTSTRVLRRGQTVTFRGAVAGAPADARPAVDLQVKRGSYWTTVKTTRLRYGTFSAKYRLTHRGTQVFRARVRQEPGFPFLPGVSKPTKVTVRP